MAFVREQKPGGMARAKQVSEGLGNLASGAMRLQVLGQQQQRLDMEKTEQLPRIDEMKARSEALRKQSELYGQQLALNQQKLEQQTFGSLMRGIAFISDSFAGLSDPKEQDAALNAALGVQESHLFNIAKNSPSISEAKDPATFRNWLKTTAKSLGPVASGMMRTGSELNKMVMGPDQGFDAKKAAQSYAQLEELGRRYMALQPSSAEVIQANLAEMRKIIDDKNARLTTSLNVGKRLEALESTRGAKGAQRDEDQLNRLLVEADKRVQPKLASLQDLDLVEGQLDAAASGVPMSIDLAQRFVGMMANKGAFSEEDRRAVKGSQSILSRLNRFTETLTTGKATKEDVEVLRQVLGKMKTNINSSINRTYRDFAKQRGGVFQGVTEADLLDRFGITAEQPGLRAPGSSSVENAPITGLQQQAAPAAPPATKSIEDAKNYLKSRGPKP